MVTSVSLDMQQSMLKNLLSGKTGKMSIDICAWRPLDTKVYQHNCIPDSSYDIYDWAVIFEL